MLGPLCVAGLAHQYRCHDGDRRSSRAPRGAQGEGRRRGGPRSSPRRRTIQFLATSFTERLRSRHRPSNTVLSAQTKDAARLDAIGDDIWAAAEHAFYNTNTVWFTRSQRKLGHPDGYTLRAIFGTDDPSIINAIPREDFLVRVNAKKQDLELLPASKSEVTARRAEWEAGTPMFKHDGCSIAFPENNFEQNFSVHLTAHRVPRGHFERKAGQPPTPLTVASHYCRSMTACTDCQTWVQKVAEGSVSLETPGAGWVPSRSQVFRCAARVRAALPEITFGGVDLHVAGPSKRGPTAVPVRSSKRARKPPKSRDV